MKVFVAVYYDEFDRKIVKAFSTKEKAQNQLYIWGGQRLFDAFHRAGVKIDEECEGEFFVQDITDSWVEYDQNGNIEFACWGKIGENKVDCWIEEVEIE